MLLQQGVSSLPRIVAHPHLVPAQFVKYGICDRVWEYRSYPRININPVFVHK